MIFTDAKEAAKKIAPIFKEMGWDWLGVGIPDERQIYEHLIGLKTNISEIDNCWRSESGRLIVEITRDSRAFVFGMAEKSESQWMSAKCDG